MCVYIHIYSCALSSFLRFRVAPGFPCAVFFFSRKIKVRVGVRVRVNPVFSRAHTRLRRADVGRQPG